MDIRFYHNPENGILTKEKQMTQNKFPPGWDEARVQSVITHYEQQTEDAAVAEDEAAFM